MHRSKLYKSRIENIDVEKHYTLTDALQQLKSQPTVKFDETVEITMKLGIDPRKSDQNVRGAISLPNGTGKNTRILVVAAGDAAEDAKNAGADFVGVDDMIEKVKGGWLDFDVMIATPDAMKKVRPLGRVLGPRGLMPNPKIGTVTDNVAEAVKLAKQGRVEYRADRTSTVHAAVGKVSFDADKLHENAMALVNAVIKARPATTKGTYFLSASLCSTMSPGLKIDVRDIT